MIELGQVPEQTGELKPARGDVPEYRPAREVERRAAVVRGDDPLLAAKRQRLATYLASDQDPDVNSPRGRIFDAEV